MTDSSPSNRLALQLLQQDQPLSDVEYKEYRMKLEQELRTVEYREKLALRAASVSIVIAFIVMIIGGSSLVGDFDPWSKDATILSITLGVIYVLAWIVFLVSVATSVSRFLPRKRELKAEILEVTILTLHGEIAELRKQVATLQTGDEAQSV